MPKAPTPASPLEALKAGFRRACIRRLVGDEEGAVAVLRDEIPGLVVSWAKSTPMESSQKKAKLKEMFDDESGRADELAVAFDLFAGRFETRVAEIVKNEVHDFAKGIDNLLQGLNSTIKRVDKISQKLSFLERSSQAPQALTNEAIDSPLYHKMGDAYPEVFKTEVQEDSSRDLMDTFEPDYSAETMVPKAGKDTLQVLPANEDKNSHDNNFNELDPPSGTGLRFDEIEEMIDEILSYDSK